MTLGSIALVTVPVTDQDRAKAFYVDVLDFTVKHDYEMASDGIRWVMLTPPGGGADITLANWFGDAAPPGSAKLSLATDDVDGAYAEVSARGGRPNGPVGDAPWGRWFGVDDPDGNNWLIVQQPG